MNKTQKNLRQRKQKELCDDISEKRYKGLNLEKE